MGIILLPLLLVAFLIWACSAFFLVRSILRHALRKRMASYWSFPVGMLIAVLTYVLLIFSWSLKDDIWALAPMFALPITHAIVPGLTGLVGLQAPRKNKVANIIGFAICVSGVISPIALSVFWKLWEADTFLSIKLVY